MSYYYNNQEFEARKKVTTVLKAAQYPQLIKFFQQMKKKPFYSPWLIPVVETWKPIKLNLPIQNIETKLREPVKNYLADFVP